MKLIIDDRLKHRLIGIAVIVSIGTIFAPALIKKSSHHFDDTVSITLPIKPIAPKVSMPETERVFNTIKKVAQVELFDLPIEDKQLAKAPDVESISTLNELKTTVLAATKEIIRLNDQQFVAQKPKILEPKATVENQQTKRLASTKPIKTLGSNHYAVQLGLFTQQRNAIALVNKLKRKGYIASYTKIANKQGIVYQVTVGQLTQKQQAVLLQQRLASALQIQGFIVKTGMS